MMNYKRNHKFIGLSFALALMSSLNCQAQLLPTPCLLYTSLANYKDAGWKQITLPRAFNEKEAFKVSIEHLSDTIMW